MTFNHSCFISYRHRVGIERFVTPFYESLSNSLSFELEGDQTIFLDRNRLNSGDILDTEIAAALCSSYCMIVLYMRSYLNSDHPYCARELKAMLELEEKRRNVIQDNSLGLIIPIILSGENNPTPSVFRNRLQNREFIPFKRNLFQFTLSQRRRFDTQVYRIADQIVKIVDKLNDYREEDCNQFVLPDANEEGVQQLILEGNYIPSSKKNHFPI